MDISELISSMEEDFISLVESDLSDSTFLTSAKLIIGDDWREVGRGIISDEAPHLMKKFEARL